MKMNNKLLEIKKTNSDCANYTGTVTIASYLGDRLIQKETHHNAGLVNLFKFISSCLQGNWHEAKFKKPCKLVLLKAGESENFEESTPINPDAKDSEDKHYWSSTYAISSPIMYTNAVVSEFTNGDNGPESSVTYHFRIPFFSLDSGSDIKKLMLLPTISSDYPTDACAYFKLNEPITVPEASGNFTVIIEWTLTFANGSSK